MIFLFPAKTDTLFPPVWKETKKRRQWVGLRQWKNRHMTASESLNWKRYQFPWWHQKELFFQNCAFGGHFLNREAGKRSKWLTWSYSFIYCKYSLNLKPSHQEESQLFPCCLTSSSFIIGCFCCFIPSSRLLSGVFKIVLVIMSGGRTELQLCVYLLWLSGPAQTSPL